MKMPRQPEEEEQVRAAALVRAQAEARVRARAADKAAARAEARAVVLVEARVAVRAAETGPVQVQAVEEAAAEPEDRDTKLQGKTSRSSGHPAAIVLKFI